MKPKKKVSLPYVFILLCQLPLGLFVGWRIGILLFRQDIGIIGIYLYLVIGLLASVLVSTAIHEGGHLVFGLMHHFSFVSYRILSFILHRKDGKLTLGRFSLSGTLGQCLMRPTAEVTRSDVLWYNMGGAIFNLIEAALSLLMLTKGRNVPAVFIGCVLFYYSVSMALSNGIPLRRTVMTNDGDNALECAKSDECVRAFNRQMEINRLLSSGRKMADIPGELLEIDDEAARGYTLISSLLCYRVDLAMEKGDHDRALELIDRLLEEGAYPLIDSQRYALMNERDYILLLRGEYVPSEDKTYRTFRKRMKNDPSVIRTDYALHLSQGDVKARLEDVERFAKAAAVYPYPALARDNSAQMDEAQRILSGTESD